MCTTRKKNILYRPGTYNFLKLVFGETLNSSLFACIKNYIQPYVLFNLHSLSSYLVLEYDLERFKFLRVYTYAWNTRVKSGIYYFRSANYCG